MKDFWKIRCMLRKAQQGAKRPLDEAPLRPAGGFGGRCKPPKRGFENPENLTHKKQYFSDIF